MAENYEQTLAHVNTNSKPTDLKITDMRFVDIVGAPMHCTLLRIETNQGITGYGEVRDGASKLYAQMLKRFLIGENPCNIDKIFRRIKQFGGQSRQAGGVCGVELALWDIAGKAYGIPVYQMLGGKFRDKVRMYCDTDVDGKDTGLNMGDALKKRVEKHGYTMLKMDLGINQLWDVEGGLCAPAGFLEQYGYTAKMAREAKARGDKAAARWWANRNYDVNNIAHPFTGIHITTKGFDYLENYVKEVRSVIGYEIPLSIDHFGHIGVEDCIKLANRLENYNMCWLEDMIPWQLTDQYVRLHNASTTPIATGEDIYLLENFKPLLDNRAVSIIHPDILSSGGHLRDQEDRRLRRGVRRGDGSAHGGDPRCVPGGGARRCGDQQLPRPGVPLQRRGLVERHGQGHREAQDRRRLHGGSREARHRHRRAGRRGPGRAHPPRNPRPVGEHGRVERLDLSRSPLVLKKQTKPAKRAPFRRPFFMLPPQKFSAAGQKLFRGLIAISRGMWHNKPWV